MSVYMYDLFCARTYIHMRCVIVLVSEACAVSVCCPGALYVVVIRCVCKCVLTPSNEPLRS